MAGERILAVDDEIFYRTFYNDALSSEGHIVHLAESGRIALSALAREWFDLIIVDYAMEGIGSLEFLEVVRKRDPFLPVVVAGPPNVHEALIALRGGAADYLNKPLVAEEFRSSIRSILDRSKALRERVLSFSGNLEQLEILETLGKCKEILSVMGEEEVFESLLNMAVEKTIASKGAFLWQGRDASAYIPRAQRGLMVSQLLPLVAAASQGIIGTILSQGSPAILGPILEEDPSSLYLGRNSTLILPMERKKTIWGGLILADKLSGEPFTDRDIRSLIPIATLVPFELGAEREKVAQATGGRRISLDGLADQDTLEVLVDKETNKSKRYRRSLSLILVNLDELRGFLEKSIALSPEEILRQLHISLLNTIRSADIAALMENGEIGLLAPETNYQGAIATARRIRHAIQELPIMRGLVLPSPFPIAFGIACFPEHGSSKDELLDRARQAMRRSAESAARFENLWGYMDKLLAEARITSELLGALGGSREKKGGEELVSLPRDSDQLLPTGEHSKELQYLASWEDFRSFSQYVEEKILERLAGEGIFYIGTKASSQLQAELEKYYRMQENGIKVFLFTQEEWEKEEEELRDIVLVVTEDPALAGYSFYIYYGVSACYALVGRQREEEAMCGFFTISDFLVSELMGKITETYL